MQIIYIHIYIHIDIYICITDLYVRSVLKGVFENQIPAASTWKVRVVPFTGYPSLSNIGICNGHKMSTYTPVCNRKVLCLALDIEQLGAKYLK